MGWPDLTYRSRMEPELRNELEQLVALIIGWNAKEHRADGQHTTITVDGVQFRDGQGNIVASITIEGGRLVITGPPLPAPGGIVLPHPAQIGNITVADDHDVEFAAGTALSLIGFAAPDGAPHGSTFAHYWTIGSRRDTRGQCFAIGDHVAQAYGLCLYYSAPIYALNPPAGGSPNVYKIGERGLNILWDEISARQIYAQAGYTERTRTVPMGEWTAVPYNAADFFGLAGMTWAVDPGDVGVFAYTLVGKTITVQLIIFESTVGGVSAASLAVRIPGGLVAARRGATLMWGLSVGSNITILAQVLPGATQITFERSTFAAWTLGGSTYVYWTT